MSELPNLKKKCKICGFETIGFKAYLEHFIKHPELLDEIKLKKERCKK